MFLSFTKELKLMIYKTGKGIIQTGNLIISPTHRPLIKKILLQNASHFHQEV